MNRVSPDESTREFPDELEVPADFLRALEQVVDEVNDSGVCDLEAIANRFPETP